MDTEEEEIYFNAFRLELNRRKINVLVLKTVKGIYGKNVKPKLMENKHLAFKTSCKGEIVTVFIAPINKDIKSVKTEVENEIGKYVSILEESCLEVNNFTMSLFVNAICKLLEQNGWNCKYHYGVGDCTFCMPIDMKYGFKFHRQLIFRVEYINEEVLFIVQPKLRIFGPYIDDIIEKIVSKNLDIKTMLINRECVAPRREDGTIRYRKALIKSIGYDPTTRKYILDIVFFDGDEKRISADKVRLAGNVLFYKSLLLPLIGEEGYESLERTQRSLSFSLGPKESHYQLGLTFKDAIISLLKDISIFPFSLGETKVYLTRHELYKV